MMNKFIRRIASWPRRRRFRWLKERDVRYFRGRHSCVYSMHARNRLGVYYVPVASMHRPCARAILQGGVWEAETLAYLGRHCGTGDFIHAGTYFGDFLPALSHSLTEGAQLWAFEPEALNFDCT